MKPSEYLSKLECAEQIIINTFTKNLVENPEQIRTILGDISNYIGTSTSNIVYIYALVNTYYDHQTRAHSDEPEKKIYELQEKLDVAVEALKEISSWCITPEDPDECRIAECKVARMALAKIQGDK